MVDENRQTRTEAQSVLLVQIPLWSMKTPDGVILRVLLPGSDSSMVDENALNLALNKIQGDVQIPLWSMKTIYQCASASLGRPFRFLYGR